ncbi:MAG: type I restriction-modification system subunit M [Bacteroidota bacterium]|nr:type I restriction-modification system subunit M [Bacteroidota bacterium]
MAVKKSELYSSLWASCDELRGGMDASQYKDYVLVMLFIKYISDKYAGVHYAPITVPEGASFKDMVKLKGKPTIGEDINKKIIGKIAEANHLTGTIDLADFDNPDKLGSGKDMVQKLTNLIAIFENPELDFSKNKAEGDDILGDAYEYLMRHFATESGKSKGQFYTPAEVSRVIAKIIGISSKNTSAATTVYDPTCGSGSLLLKVGDEAEKNISLFGQENDVATAALARMNMVLHNHASDVLGIKQGNTLASPLFLDNNGSLKTFDYVVANPPFSYKSWGNGVDAVNDMNRRFQDYGIPPKKNGDYAFLLHIIRSLKSKGKGCVVMPLGVLFRGNTEADIRKNIIQRGYVKGIIGLPPNLFYGTGIAACLIVIDKENAENRKGIFMVDASKGFIKDGNKNRLRDEDIHKIVDTFNNQIEVPKYSRIIPIAEIADTKNDYNLNIPRYIDSQEAEDLQDIEAHLLGDIPNRDIDELQNYWEVYPTLKNTLFTASKRANYSALYVAKEEIKNTIFQHPEFTAFSKKMDAVFNKWKNETIAYAKALDPVLSLPKGKPLHPKKEIQVISENLLKHYTDKQLTDKYAMYQHIMDYWAETMQDDMYELTDDGWKAGKEVKRIEKKTKASTGSAQEKAVAVKYVQGIEGLEGRLIPPALIIQEYFVKEQKAIDDLETQAETLTAKMDELREEYGSTGSPQSGGEDGLLANAIDDKGKISKGNLQKAIKELGKRNADNAEEYDMLNQYKKLMDDEAEVQTKIKVTNADLEKKVIAQYPKLSIDEIKSIVVEKKWMRSMEHRIRTEMDNISHRLTQRIKELAERYETPLPQQNKEVKDLEEKVNTHLKKMGFVWK